MGAFGPVKGGGGAEGRAFSPVKGGGGAEDGVSMIARMWEVRALGSGFDELLSWVCDHAVPQLEVLPQHVASEVFSSTDHRIVVISKWRNNPQSLPPPPDKLVARAPHVWDFTPVDR